MIPREERGPVLNGLPTTLPDVDPEETQEWIESLDKMVETDGPNRARIVLLKMLERARSHSRLGQSALTSTDYINTIAAEDEEEYPGDAEIERTSVVCCAGIPPLPCIARSVPVLASAVISPPMPLP